MFDVQPHREIVRLTVTHENLADADALRAASVGWPGVLANLKSPGDRHVLPQAPWDMRADLRAAQLASSDPRWPPVVQALRAELTGWRREAGLEDRSETTK